MKLLIVLACSFLSVSAVSFTELVLEEWKLFKIQHKKNYSSDSEEKFRLKAFMENKHEIAKHNAKYERGEVTYKLGLNKYSDLLHSEFVRIMNGYRGVRNHQGQRVGGIRKTGSKTSTYVPPTNVKLPDEVNWVKKGAVTPVKDQGMCGSCWAFSATGSLEGQHFLKKGVLVSLSEQNLVDCSGPEGNNGCNGGFMDNAFHYVKVNNGIDTEESYPYRAVDGTCRFNPNTTGATDKGEEDLTSGDEGALQAAVANIGPISVAIDASRRSFHLYTGGVYSDRYCRNDFNSLDHGVLVVGYGVDKETNQKYWLVKNSWGDSWGEKGYIRMARDKNNMCGIATLASYPVV